MRVARPIPNTLRRLQRLHQALQSSRIKVGFDHDTSPAPHHHAETTPCLFCTQLLDRQLHRHQPVSARFSRYTLTPQVTTECTQRQILALAKFDLSKIAALKFTNNLLDLGRRTPTSPPPQLLFVSHATYFNTQPPC